MKPKHFFILTFLLVLLLSLAMSVVWWVNPILAFELRAEGRFFQNLTVVFYLLATAIGSYYVISQRLKTVYCLIPTLSFLGAAEELSWIERLMEPPVIAGVNIDAIHDLIEVAYIVLVSNYPFWVSLLAVICIAAIIGGVIYSGKIYTFLRKHPPLLIVCIALAFLVLAQITDMRLENTHFQKYFFEEMFENIGALLFLLAGFSLRYVNGFTYQIGTAMGTRKILDICMIIKYL